MKINRSLELCEVPSCFKHSTIILAPEKHSTTGLNDYSPMILMSVVMKSFEGLVLTNMKDIIGPLLDICSLPNRQTGQRMMQSIWAVNMALHPATAQLHRDIGEDPVCGLQLSVQHNHP